MKVEPEGVLQALVDGRAEQLDGVETQQALGAIADRCKLPLEARIERSKAQLDELPVLAPDEVPQRSGLQPADELVPPLGLAPFALLLVLHLDELEQLADV